MRLSESGRLQINDFGEGQISARFFDPLSNIQYIDTLIQVDTTIYHVTKGYTISAIVTELKMKLTFY